MTILAPGSFKTSDYRHSITDKVTREVLKRYRRDHRPPLNARPYDTKAGDFIPQQLDPNFIDLVEIARHDERTFGRKAGAEKTVSGRGSDITEAARAKNISDSKKIHDAKMLSKAGDYKGAAMAIAGVKKKSRLREKKKIPSRPFQKQSRPMQSRPF